MTAQTEQVAAAHLALDRDFDDLLRHLDIGHGIDPNTHDEHTDLAALEARHEREHADEWATTDGADGLAALRRLSDAATAGPWTYETVDSIAGGSLYDADVMIAGLQWDDEPAEPIRRTRTVEQADANGALIAAAVNHVRRTLDALDALTEGQS